jgi:hypothetical protein
VVGDCEPPSAGAVVAAGADTEVVAGAVLTSLVIVPGVVGLSGDCVPLLHPAMRAAAKTVPHNVTVVGMHDFTRG